MNLYIKYEKSKYKKLEQLGRYLKYRILERFFKGIYSNYKRDNYRVECLYREK